MPSYSVQTFIYKYHPVYGSPPVANKMAKVQGVQGFGRFDACKGFKIDGLTQYHMTITCNWMGSGERDNFYSLVQPSAYYTLNEIPEGKMLADKDMSTYHSSGQKDSTEPASVSPQAVSFG